MRPSTRRRVLSGPAAAALSVGLLLAASACTGEPDSADEQPAAATGEQTTQTPAPSTASPNTLTESASPTEPSTTESTGAPTEESTEPEAEDETEPESSPSEAAVQPPPPGSGPKAMLLRSREVPGLNAQHSWKTIGTANREGRQTVWACQVTDFSSIGATDVWVRRLVGRPGGRDSATTRSAVISFADPQSAARGFAVLRSWHDRCEDQLQQQGYQRARVDAAPTDVNVASGDAEWRLAIYGPVKGEQDAGYFDATGYVKEGSRISLVTMVNVGQDYNYPRGQEPIVGAVQNAATKLLG
jgi:hypothetical protein